MTKRQEKNCGTNAFENSFDWQFIAQSGNIDSTQCDNYKADSLTKTKYFQTIAARQRQKRKGNKRACARECLLYVVGFLIHALIQNCVKLNNINEQRILLTICCRS